jgi:hypothetical protein
MGHITRLDLPRSGMVEKTPCWGHMTLNLEKCTKVSCYFKWAFEVLKQPVPKAYHSSISFEDGELVSL